MFLLIRLLSRQCRKSDFNLHSTMFLLIRKIFHQSKSHESIFTFHNVSINTYTEHRVEKPVFWFTFHNVSINTVDCYPCWVSAEKFTFHNVSINTVFITEGNERHEDLHSTMFLLIRLMISLLRWVNPIFTFHNVSINTPCACLIATFYLIYIPQCFY